MAFVEQAIADRLTTDATVASLVATRVFPEILPQDPTYPAIAYQRITTQRVRSMDGPSGLSRPRIQIDCYAAAYAQAKALADAVRLALDGKRFSYAGLDVQAAFLEDERDQEASEGRDIDDERRVSLDFFVWHTEAKS